MIDEKEKIVLGERMSDLTFFKVQNYSQKVLADNNETFLIWAIQDRNQQHTVGWLRHKPQPTVVVDYIPIDVCVYIYKCICILHLCAN